MKIYTRTGDGGSTSVYAKKSMRVEKDDSILAAYGDIDELNGHLGVLVNTAGQHALFLQNIQQNLFQVGFAVSAETQLNQSHVTVLEAEIDRLSEQLPVQTHFILPGGCSSAAQSHLCRAVCRRAERALVTVSRDHDVAPEILAYVNRLSDYFFVLARYLNISNQVSEIKV